MNFERENERNQDVGNFGSSESGFIESGNSTSSSQIDSGKQTKKETINRDGRLIKPRINEIFKRYIEDKLSSKEPLPFLINQSGYALDREEISNEIYRKYGFLINSSNHIYECGLFNELKQLLMRQLEDQGKTVPTDEEKRIARVNEIQRRKQFTERLELWLEKLKESGNKLMPSKINGKTDLEWISRQTGIPYSFLTRINTECAGLIKRAKTEIGFDTCVPEKELRFQRFTYRQLLDFGTDLRTKETKSGNTARNQVNNTRTTLIRYLRENHIDFDTIIGAEFGTGFGETSEQTAAAILNKYSRKKFMSEIRRWQRYYSALLLTDSLPADFPGALRMLIEKSDWIYRDIEKIYYQNKETSYGILSSWVTGKQSPSLKMLPLIHLIEDCFKLSRGTLTSRVYFNSRRDVRPVLKKGNFQPMNEAQINRVRSFLPDDFAKLPEEEQKKLVTDILDNVIYKANPYRKSLRELQKIPYRLAERYFPPGLNQEIDELILFKTGFLPPSGYKRDEKNVWKNDSRNGTIKIFISILKTFFGILSLPKEKGGRDVEIRQMTITLLILPQTWRDYFRFNEKRSGGVSYNYAFRVLSTVLSLMDPETGWITQSPSLAERLEPIPGLLSEVEIQKAKSDWKSFIGYCRNELDVIQKILKKQRAGASLVRDSHLPILPILESDEPLAILIAAIEAYETNIPNKYTSPLLYAIRIRNIVYLRMLAETALRSENMVGMTWSVNNAGHLKRAPNGQYFLEIPHTQFKNQNSSFFGPPGRKHPYCVPLTKTLSHWLDEYINHCRPLLIEFWREKKRGTDQEVDEGFLFVTGPGGKSERLSHGAATKLLMDFSHEYLVYNPLTKSGIPGVEPFREHAVRHIVATHVLKKTGSFRAAADAIQDTEETARRHYTRYLPSERDKIFRQIISDLIDKDEDA